MKQRESYLVFGAPVIGDEERAEVQACIDSKWLGTGPRVARFEEEFKAYVGAPAVAAVNSGTAALHLSLKLLGLPPGSEVITTAMTFCATANAILHAGYTPVFADCERDSMNLDPADVARKITPRTKAILPVHFAGRPCEMGALLELASRHDLRVVEDCAHAVEATYDGRHAGTFGDFGCFSFYVNKNLTTVEGGMVVCKDAEMAARVKMLALHGMSKNAWSRFSDQGPAHYEVLEPGFKYNLTDLAASFGIHQLRRVEQAQVRRRALWSRYEEGLAGLPLILPAKGPDHLGHAHHLFVCLVDDTRTELGRDQVMAALHARKIGSGVHYRPVHLHRWYAERYGYKEGALPNAEWIGKRTFSLPFTAGMSDADADDVISALREIFG